MPRTVRQELRAESLWQTLSPHVSHANQSAAALAATTVDWGRTRYTGAWQRQEALVARRIAARSATRSCSPSMTRCSPSACATAPSSISSGPRSAWPAKASRSVKTNRGGDITYHGPGQLVGYPIVNLTPRPDLHAYLRFLEQVVINSVGCLGLAADRRAGKTGVWLGARKIAAVGVAVRRWVTYHGFALNVNAHLAHFRASSPAASVRRRHGHLAASRARPPCRSRGGEARRGG